MRIRPALPPDAAALAELAARTFVETFAAANTAEDIAAYVAATYGQALQEAEIADPSMLTLIAEDDGPLVAFAQMRLGDRIEIARFYVARERHGRGIAHALMDAVIAAAGSKTLWLGVWEHNPRAIRFYEKCGFRVTGTQPFLLGSDVQTDLVMVRLPP